MTISTIRSCLTNTSRWLLDKGCALARHTADRATSFASNYLPFVATPALALLPTLAVLRGAYQRATAEMPCELLGRCTNLDVMEPAQVAAGIIILLSMNTILIRKAYQSYQNDKKTKEELEQRQKKSTEILKSKKAEFDELLQRLPISGTQDRSLLYIQPERDWNGAIYNNLSKNEEFLRELSQNHEIIPIWAGGKTDLAQKVQAAREMANFSIEAVIIEAHGSTNRMVLGERENPDSFCDSDDLAKIFQFLPRHSRLLVNSCEAGKCQQLTAKLAKKLNGVRVYGSSNKTSFSKTILFFDPVVKRPCVRYLDNELEDDTTTIYTQDRYISPALSLSELQALERKALDKKSPKIAFYIASTHETEGRFQRAYQWYELTKKWGCQDWEKSADIPLTRLEAKKDITSSGNPADALILRELPNLAPFFQ